MRSICFLNDLKLAEVSPILKKKKSEKDNYRPVGVPPPS